MGGGGNRVGAMYWEGQVSLVEEDAGGRGISWRGKSCAGGRGTSWRGRSCAGS